MSLIKKRKHRPYPYIDTLLQLLGIFDLRHIGATHVAIKGLSTEDVSIVVHDVSMKHYLTGRYCIPIEKIFSLSEVCSGALLGSRKPVILDHKALSDLFYGVLSEFNARERDAVEMLLATCDSQQKQIVALTKDQIETDKRSGHVYLIHLDEPYKGKQHYLGFTKNKDLSKRLRSHQVGTGSKFLKAANDACIGYKMVRVWQEDRNFERRLKNRKRASLLCPCCNPNSWFKNG